MYNKEIFDRCFCWHETSWWRNITRGIPQYIKQIHFLLKNGYDIYAPWETCDWFVEKMKHIFNEYLTHHWGYPCEFETGEEWETIIRRMISLLEKMGYLDDSIKDYEKHIQERDAAKDEFFELFSKYFYNLWD